MFLSRVGRRVRQLLSKHCASRDGDHSMIAHPDLACYEAAELKYRLVLYVQDEVSNSLLPKQYLGSVLTRNSGEEYLFLLPSWMRLELTHQIYDALDAL